MPSLRRIWRGWTPPERADAYETLLLERVLPGIEAKRIPGYRGAFVGRREVPEGVEFVTILSFASLDAVRTLAGEDPDVAYVPDEARALLSDFERRAAHYAVVLDPAPDARDAAPGSGLESASALASALRDVVDAVGDGMWHGPSLGEAVEGVDADAAAARPIPDAHTIWELVLHVGQWAEIVGERIAGRSVEVTPERNFPPVADVSEEAWSEALERVRARYQALADQAATLTGSGLWREGEEGRPSPGVEIRGVIEHGVYHAGQIMLLRRALGLV